MKFSLKEIENKENEFTETFFGKFLRDVTETMRNVLISAIAERALVSVKNIDVQYKLTAGVITDVRISLETGENIFVEVKINAAAYRPGQIREHVAAIAKDFGTGHYLFIDKSRGDFPAIKEEREAIKSYPSVSFKHANWYDIYQILERTADEITAEYKDNYLIKEILNVMEGLRMKPFKGLDTEQRAYLEEVTKEPDRDLSAEVDEIAKRILDEVKYLLGLKYADIGTEISEDKKSKFIIIQITLLNVVTDDINPDLTIQWRAKAKEYGVWLGLYKETEDGYIFPLRLFLPLARLCKGRGFDMGLYFLEDPKEIRSVYEPLDEWLENTKEIPGETATLYIGNCLYPEEYEGRAIINVIMDKISALIEALKNITADIGKH